MCWKQEWAAAYNNLQWAIIHTERAKTKLEKRALNDMKHTLSPADVEAAKIGKVECDDLIRGFKEDQEILKNLIENVGIWVKDDPSRTRTLMEGRRQKRGLPWEPIQYEHQHKKRGAQRVDDQTFIIAWNEHATVQGVANSVGLDMTRF